MGFIGGLIGAAGGVNGTGIAAPQSANILNPTTVAQANTSYTSNQAALAQQQSFLQAVQAQNGLQNQSNVFNQFQGVVNGTGPNPAQAQLAQSTGANVANQAALMAGQRGSGANAGLIARQAAMQGANTQQQSAGQAATLQAQQSLNALNSAGSLATSQANQQAAATSANTSAQQGEQNTLLNSINAQNNANVSMQSNINSANAGLAGQTMKGQQDLLGNMTGAAGSAMGLAEGGMVPRKMYADPTSVVSPEDSAPMTTTPPPTAQTPAPANGPKSSVGKYFSQPDDPNAPKLTGMASTGNVIGKGLGTLINNIFGSSTPKTSGSEDYYGVSGDTPIGDAADQESNAMKAQDSLPSVPQAQEFGGQDLKDVGPGDTGLAAKGGKVPAMVSPGETYLSPDKVKQVKKGANPLSVGERIPGTPKVAGNSYANDVVPKTLESGGVVIPNSIMQSKDASKKAAKFVEAILAKNAKSLPKRGNK